MWSDQRSPPSSRKERKGSILKSTSLFKKNGFTRSSTRSTKTIRFQRQDSFDLSSNSTSGDPENNHHDLHQVGAEEKCLLEEEEPAVKPGRGRKARILTREPSSFTGDELISLKAAFSKLDCDGDGTLSQVNIIPPTPTPVMWMLWC